MLEIFPAEGDSPTDIHNMIMRFNLLFCLCVFALTGDIKWIMLFTLVTIALVFIHTFSANNEPEEPDRVYAIMNTQEADPMLRGNIGIQRSERKFDPLPSDVYYTDHTRW